MLFRETRQLSAAMHLRAGAGQNFAIGSKPERTGWSVWLHTSSVVFVVLEHVSMGWEMRG